MEFLASTFRPVESPAKFRRGAVVAVLDLDFMEEGARIDDLALVLYYANSGSILSRRRSPPERLRGLRELVDAYDAGLERRLAPAERAALPLALARTPLKRAVAQAEAPELTWALSIAKHPDPWRAAFR
jgi:Ser/Thr protein kinase RdoA (MazF antagonist)